MRLLKAPAPLDVLRQVLADVAHVFGGVDRASAVRNHERRVEVLESGIQTVIAGERRAELTCIPQPAQGHEKETDVDLLAKARVGEELLVL